MKKSYKRLLIFEIILFILLLLNSFISSILSKYNIIIILIIATILFKLIFGLEKDHHRGTKDLILEFIAIILIFFILFYLSGLYLGFIRTGNYFDKSGLKYFLIPITLINIIKEYLRYNINEKGEGSKIIIFISILLFIYIDISSAININIFTSAYNTFVFIALYILPSISSNLTCTYIAKKFGYKPNIIWLLVIRLYYYILPIVPKAGEYLESLILILFPLILTFRVYLIITKLDDLPLERNYQNPNWTFVIIVTILTCMMVYFSSGLFHYYAVSIGSGSMSPKINKGDVVIIEKTTNPKYLKEGEVIAYKYKDRIIVHRLYKKINDQKEYFYYTKGDANKDVDNYAIKQEMLIGKVTHKIKYLGWPVIWLNNL